MTVISTPRWLFAPSNSGPGYTLCRAFPREYSRRLMTAETPPYAQPTIRTRCGLERVRLPTASVTPGILIMKVYVGMAGKVKGEEMGFDLIRLQPRIGDSERLFDASDAPTSAVTSNQPASAFRHFQGPVLLSPSCAGARCWTLIG
jgi:hypothetical protein